VPQSCVLLVQSSLSSLGWVCGGPVAVVRALLDVLGPSGTLVVHAHTAGNSDPATRENPSRPQHSSADVPCPMFPTSRYSASTSLLSGSSRQAA
jgi:aminoglycoside 3-N-acetyltransferase